MGRAGGRESVVWRCEAGPGSVSDYQSGGKGRDCEGRLGEGRGGSGRVRKNGWMDGIGRRRPRANEVRGEICDQNESIN